MAPGESQILDETADLENDINDTTTLGGFIADDTTLNETGNWTQGKIYHMTITRPKRSGTFLMNFSNI